MGTTFAYGESLAQLPEETKRLVWKTAVSLLQCKVTAERFAKQLKLKLREARGNKKRTSR